MAKIDDSVKKKVPELRFKGFTDPWVQRNLGDVIKNQYNGQTPSRNTPSFWGGEIPWLTSGELNHGIVNDTVETITAAGQKDANLKIVPAGTFVMAITGLEAPGTRGNSSILGFDTTVNQSVMALFPNEKLDTKFLFQWYQKVGEEYGISYTQGTKQQSYNAELIKILPFTLPDTVEEQQRIAELLFKLDNLIAANQRKLDLLKEQKKGYLQKMFPKNGEKVPELRFAGFADAWEQRKFDECFNFPVSTNSLSRALLNYDEGDIKSVHYGDILIKYPAILNIKNDKIPYITGGKLEKYKSSLLENGDLIFADAAEDETVGKAVEVNGLTEENLVAGLHTIVARSKDKKAEFFLGYYINSNTYHRQLLRLIQGSKVSSISKGNLQKTLVSFPKDFKEQQKIGSFFKKIDETIALHQRKLDLLKEQKKGFLQKMFV